MAPAISDRFIIGVDEAGRGPLAGPVAVGALAVRHAGILRRFRGVKDSKQLTADQRDEWYERIKESSSQGDVFFAVSFASPEIIDEKGLTYAVYSALNRALKRLESMHEGCREAEIRLDGLLHASSRYEAQETIVGGDESEPVIALASICAKVLRDRRMSRLAREYPQYGFEAHKGYGTRAHYKAIEKFGITPLHRRRFLGIIK